MPERSKYMELFANTGRKKMYPKVLTLLVLIDVIDELIYMIYMDELNFIYMEILVISNLQLLLQCCR